MLPRALKKDKATWRAEKECAEVALKEHMW
jgi:hypothetical protein